MEPIIGEVSETKRCPQCGGWMFENDVQNARSRTSDAEVFICPACGVREAMDDYVLNDSVFE